MILRLIKNVMFNDIILSLEYMISLLLCCRTITSMYFFYLVMKQEEKDSRNRYNLWI